MPSSVLELVRVLEMIAAVMGLEASRGVSVAGGAERKPDHGHTELHVEFQDGHLRRWGTADPRNGARELSGYDDDVRAGLAALVEVLRARDRLG